MATSLETQERKMVTVLFADLVDSTGLAQRLDVERARNLLGRFYDAVTEEVRTLRGQPERFIGDAVMAVFGLPHVHEDDAVRAVRAGLAIRGRLRRLSEEIGLEPPLQVHVGVETGEAATGVAPAGQLLVTGPVVNAAARLQGASRPDEVLAGATTWALTERAVSFAEGRTVEAKGFAEPLAAHPVTGLTNRSVRRTIPFVGRANELTLLRDAHARVTSTGRPLMVTVVGESGIGKSRLVEEFVAAIPHGGQDDPGLMVGRSQLASDSATFAPVGSIVREAAGIGHADTPHQARSRLQILVERWLSPYGVSPDERERTFDRLALVLGLHAPRRDESSFIQDVQAGFTALVQGMAAVRPAVLVFEDAHAFRPPMLDLIERLAARGRGDHGASLVVVSARPELLAERPTWGSASANHVLLHLEPLGAEDSFALAKQAGGSRLQDPRARTVATRAGGNPFFIIETTGMLLGQDGEPSSGAWLPPTVQAVVAARLDGLPEEQRALVRRLSAYLYSFDADEVAQIAGCSDDTMRALEEAEIVVRERDGTAPRWRFRHETLRDVAYASLPKRLRRELHESIAEALLGTEASPWAADHFERAAQASLDLDPTDRRLPERAADTLASAGERARRRMENRSAVDYYGRSLAMSGPEAGWGRREARVLAGMGEARYWLGEYPAAREVLEQARELGTALDDDWTLAHALRFLGDIAINVDADVDRAEGLLAHSLEAAERLDDPRAISRTLLFAGWVPWTRQRYEDAEPIWRRALEIARKHDDRWATVRALTSLSINREHVEDWEDAQALIEEAYALADEMDDAFSAAVATVQRGRLHADLGRRDDALADFEHGVRVFSELGARWEMADALAERGITNREIGRLEDAERDLHQAIRISEELGERQLAGWTWRALARVSEKRGDRALADERFQRARRAEAERPS